MPFGVSNSVLVISFYLAVLLSLFSPQRSCAVLRKKSLIKSWMGSNTGDGSWRLSRACCWCVFEGPSLVLILIIWQQLHCTGFFSFLPSNFEQIPVLNSYLFSTFWLGLWSGLNSAMCGEYKRSNDMNFLSAEVKSSTILLG